MKKSMFKLMPSFSVIIVILLVLSSAHLPANAADDPKNDPWAALTEKDPFTKDPSTKNGGFVELPSVDTEPFYIRYNKDIYFKIPRNYLLQLTNIAYGHSKPSVFFRSEMLYPSFSGATADTLQQFDFRSWDKSPNIIMIKGPFESYAKINSNILAQENYTEKHEMHYGLMKANHPLVTPKHVDTYFTNDPKFGETVIECNTPQNVDGLPICHVYVNLNKDLVYMYEYHRDLFPHWREIHEHVTSFINEALRKE